ncbi:flagellar hook-associated protein 2 [Brevibacillus humidisoli]|uniref:flagellar hook-associated protein 2 n=1 Tax=Brevibacillus humidisoli TaxID=2895522 RepID=UPI001E602ED1|nr:flagellar hook-associated protein 2 [Brevibacillus humidisoli]UFJ40045.1 flagellar hook-associated protein 2 [Brevibacillus humidisoli]
MVGQIRFGGMASGLDTEKIVKELMKAERMPVDRLHRQKQLQEWKRDAYREMNTLMLELQQTIDSLRFSGSFNKKIATSENSNVVSATATGKPGLSTYSIEVLQLAEPSTPPVAEFTTSTTDSTAALGASFTFTIDKTIDGTPTTASITVEATDSIDSVIKKVNDANIGVKASFLNGKLVFSSTDSTAFTVNAPTDGSGAALGMNGSVTATGTAGTPGKVKINGVEHEITSNTFTYDGMELTVKQVSATPVVVSTKTDEDAVFDQIKSFVDKYNEVIEKINAKISEPRYRGYEPLTDEEREALPEKTADKLEGMAKSGLLLRDSILTTGLHNMRFAISTPLQGAGVDTAFDTLSEIGIGGPPTGKYAYQENGKLYIDEDKLRQAISENGDAVAKLFTNYSNNADPATKYKESGIAERLYDELKKTMDEVTKKAGSSTTLFDDSVLGKSIQNIDDEIDRWEDRLQTIEDRYWKQFTAMEKAIAQYNSQGSWFAQMLAQ